MKIHAYILCFNDARIIASTIAHYAQFCSRIFIMDNMSTDSTVEIAQAHPKVTVVPWSMDHYDERLLVKMKTRTYKDYSRRGGQHTDEVADWVIACDADEILYHPDLHGLLAIYREQGVTVPQTTGFNMVDEADIEPGVSLTSTFRTGIRSNRFDKRLLFAAEFDMHYSAGCHPRGHGFELMKREWNYRPSDTAELAVLHYRYIGTWAQEKAAVYVAKGAASPAADDTIPHHYHALNRGDVSIPGSGGGGGGGGEAKLVIAEDGSVQLNDFAPSSGESGIDPLLANRHKYGDELASLAEKLEQVDRPAYLEDCISLMAMASALRPKNQYFRRKLREYRKLRAAKGSGT